jgi:hypothetical protein
VPLPKQRSQGLACNTLYDIYFPPLAKTMRQGEETLLVPPKTKKFHIKPLALAISFFSMPFPSP